MNRLYPILPTLIALLAAGCIENPGVDPDVGRHEAETRILDVDFRDAPVLQLRVTQDSGRLSLRGLNRGLGKIDSAAFLLQVSLSQLFAYQGWGFDPRPAFEYYGRIPALAPNESIDLGEVDFPLPGKLESYFIQASLTQASEDGRTGSPLGGVYTGTLRGLDTSGLTFQGTVRGIITADGKFSFHASEQRMGLSLGVLMGSVEDSGGVYGYFELGYGNPGLVGRFQRVGSKVEAAIAFKHNTTSFDSLWLACDPYTPL